MVELDSDKKLTNKHKLKIKEKWFKTTKNYVVLFIALRPNEWSHFRDMVQDLDMQAKTNKTDTNKKQL